MVQLSIDSFFGNKQLHVFNIYDTISSNICTSIVIELKYCQGKRYKIVTIVSERCRNLYAKVPKLIIFFNYGVYLSRIE